MTRFTDPENLTGLVDMMQYANTVTDNSWGIAILSAVFLIIVLVQTRFEKRFAISSASYTSAILAIFFRILSLITDTQFFLFVSLCAIGVLWTILQKE
jgi:hypothetical protein